MTDGQRVVADNITGRLTAQTVVELAQKYSRAFQSALPLIEPTTVPIAIFSLRSLLRAYMEQYPKAREVADYLERRIEIDSNGGLFNG